METFALVINVLSTAAIAIFTFFVWQLNSRQHVLTWCANLGVGASKAQYNSTSKEIRVEVLMMNAGADAVIQSWDINVTKGNLRLPLTNGTLVKTALIRAPRYVGSAGWVVQRAEPTAFSIKKKIPHEHDLSSGAMVSVKIHYLGGAGGSSTLECDVPVSLA
jgi:hypothetical protein